MEKSWNPELVPLTHQKLVCDKVGMTRTRSSGISPSKPCRWHGGITKKILVIDPGASKVKQPILALMELEVQPTRQFAHLIAKLATLMYLLCH